MVSVIMKYNRNQLPPNNLDSPNLFKIKAIQKMSALEPFLNFLFNDKKQLSHKAAVGFLVILSIIIVDNFLGFSYYYNNEKKIQQVESLNAIMKDSTVDNGVKNYAKELRFEIINRKNYFSIITEFFHNINTDNKNKNVISYKPETPKTHQTIERNNIWFHITSGGLFYLIAILMIILIPFTDISGSIIQKIASGLLSGIIITAWGLLFYWICNFIPQISAHTWIWNYFVNIGIQIIVCTVLVIISQQSWKKKSKAN